MPRIYQEGYRWVALLPNRGGRLANTDLLVLSAQLRTLGFPRAHWQGAIITT